MHRNIITIISVLAALLITGYIITIAQRTALIDETQQLRQETARLTEEREHLLRQFKEKEGESLQVKIIYGDGSSETLAFDNAAQAQIHAEAEAKKRNTFVRNLPCTVGSISADPAVYRRTCTRKAHS